MAIMNKGGRPKIAVAEKQKKGTLQKSRIEAVKNSPDPPKIECVPPAPEWLGEHGKKEWDEKADLLDRMNMLHKTDLGMLAVLCKEWQNYVEAESFLDRSARFYSVYDDAGMVKYWGIHPAHTIAQQHLKAYITLCNEFGFSPASRSRISLPTSEKIVSRAAGLLKKAV